MRSTADRLRVAIGAVAAISVIGTIGYRVFGLSWLDSVYMTIISITTVGYREISADDDFGADEKIFTIFLIVVGVSTVLYTFTLVVQTVVEGQLREFVGRRRMDKKISQLSGHTIVCGWGRVGTAAAADLARVGTEVVVVDGNADRVRDIPYPTVVGDATVDATLHAAGIERARALVAAIDTDAANLFVTLSGRDLNPALFIVARARSDESVPKFEHAGADRVVNPQEIGAARMAAFVAQPTVAEFIDVIMHEHDHDFHMEEFVIGADSPLAGRTLADTRVSDESGALVLALRSPGGDFTTNPQGDTVLGPDHMIVAVGTGDDFDRLRRIINA
ncbi:MAG: potassium channel protein [Actinomycetota bacterium]